MPYLDPEEQKKASRRHYEANKDEYHKRSNGRRQAATRFVAALKERLCCVKCGEDHPKCLDFHHKPGTIKIKSVSQMSRNGCSLERVKEEIEKCEVLCSNCHRKETWHFDGECWRMKH